MMSDVQSQTTPSVGRPVILIVDDASVDLEGLSEFLMNSDCQVLVAETSERFFQILETIAPDLILLDTTLPEMDGFAICRQLKTKAETEDIPVILMTTRSNTLDKVQGFNLGAVDYLTKPLEPEEVLARIQSHLQTSRWSKQLRQQNLQLLRQVQEQRQAEIERDRLFDLSLDMLCVAGLDGYFKRVSPVCERILGLTQTELLSKPFIDFVHPEERATTLAELEKLATGALSLDFENRYTCGDGSYRWLAWRAFPVPAEGLIYAVARDITEQKQAETERLQRLHQERQLRTESEAARNLATSILESITDAFFALNQNWQFTYVNRQAETLLKKQRDELLGQTLWQAFPEAVGSIFEQQYRQAIAAQTSVIFEAFYPPLDSWFEVHAYPTREGLSVYFQEINSRKQSEEELQRQHRRSQLFAELTLKIRQSLHLEDILQTAVTEVLNFLQADRVVIFRLWAVGSGVVVKEAVGSEWMAIWGEEIVDPCFEEKYMEPYRQGRVGMFPDIEGADVERTDVESCYIEMLRRYQVRSNLVVPILQQQGLWGLLIAHQCSRPRYWTDFEVELLQQLANQIGIALAQSQLLEQETRQREELARSNTELQQFAYIASHDLQEPLRMITSYLQLLQRRYQGQLGGDADDFIAYAVDGADRMRTLIHDLLAYSRVGTRGQPFKLTDCQQVVEEAIANLKVAIVESQATIHYDSLPQVMGDPVQLAQLFQNLIGNAIKFQAGTPPMIHIGCERREGEWLFFVQDHGIGIESQYTERIFVIFQRLHNRSEYPGTGIGLAICRKIVERHSGRIWVNSEVGKGSTFYFTIAERGGDPHEFHVYQQIH